MQTRMDRLIAGIDNAVRVYGAQMAQMDASLKLGLANMQRVTTQLEQGCAAASRLFDWLYTPIEEEDNNERQR